jgi:hypothetical protein
MKFFDFSFFIVSFAIGIFIVYSLGPEKKEIVVYPSYDTLQNIQYKDDTGSCFSFDIESVKCPLNPDSIFQIPVQVD